MQIEETAIAEVKIVTPRRFGDGRGYFSEFHNRQRWQEAGLDLAFVQDNISYSAQSGTVRGLHFQLPPFAQAKLVGVLTGRILDIALDLRKGSPSYRAHVAVELDAESGRQLLIPAGFAHGFCTLMPETRVLYKVSAVYSAAHDSGIFWADPELKIEWPVSSASAILSEKDARLPRLADIDLPFTIER